jgi:hypothetical protein
MKSKLSAATLISVQGWHPLSTYPPGFFGGWVDKKAQKNPLLSKNHRFFRKKFLIILGYSNFL